eukprot:7360444-Prymnesium_polylepis.1
MDGKIGMDMYGSQHSYSADSGMDENARQMAESMKNTKTARRGSARDALSTHGIRLRLCITEYVSKSEREMLPIDVQRAIVFKFKTGALSRIQVTEQAEKCIKEEIVSDMRVGVFIFHSTPEPAHDSSSKAVLEVHAC